MEEFLNILLSRNTYIGIVTSFLITLLSTKIDSLNVWKMLIHKRIFLAILLFFVVLWCILSFDYSYWWLSISLIPLYYQFLILPHEWVLICVMKKHKKFYPKWGKCFFTIRSQMHYTRCQILFSDNQKEQQELSFQYLNSLNIDTLFPYEIRNFYLPALHVLIAIGDYSRLRRELDKLSSYSNQYLYMHYQVCLAFNAGNYNTMLVWLNKSENVKRNEEQELTDIINRICAYANLHDKLNIQKWLDVLEEKTSKGYFNIKAIENLIIFYEQKHDYSRIEHLISIVQGHTYKDFNTYTHSMDIVYNYYKRQNNVEAKQKLIKQLCEKAKTLITSEEEQIRTKIRMLRLKFECNDGWQEYSRELFLNAESYLKYSRNVAVDFMEVTKNVLMDAHIVYNLRIPDNVYDNLIVLIHDYLEPHIQTIEKEFANLDDSFVYRKKELLMYMRTFLYYDINIENHIIDICNKSLNIYKQVIYLCIRSENFREAQHFRVCLVDDILSYRDQILQLNNEKVTSEYKKHLSYYEKEAKDVMFQIEDVIRKDGFSPSQAYYILYLCQFYHQLDQCETARFYFYKFTATGIDIRNFSLAIQKMYYFLKDNYTS